MAAEGRRTARDAPPGGPSDENYQQRSSSRVPCQDHQIGGSEVAKGFYSSTVSPPPVVNGLRYPTLSRRLFLQRPLIGTDPMPEIHRFQLQNFKGAEDVTIELGGKHKAKVVTLIGLNESGKTTILEGISHFATRDRTVSSLFVGPHAQRHISTLIPVHKKAAFTDTIRISADIELTDSDVKGIVALGLEVKLEIDPESVQKKAQVTKQYRFIDSEFVADEFSSLWEGFDFKARRSKKQSFKWYKRPDDEEKDVWLAAADAVESRLPKVIYFPTFIVNLPAKIYLSELDKECRVNRYYRNLLQEILDTMPDRLSLERHVVQRIKAYREEDATSAWLSRWLGDSKRAPVDSVFQKISATVTKEVLGSWSKVFNRPVAAKRIEVSWNVDTDNNDLPYAAFAVSDGESIYALDERSLGFRWFFSFLLFTRFRGSARRENVFLFDEPAANLHACAQAELLGSFDKLIEEGNKIIYSTHSHHMINPRWLSGAHIVENDAIDYEAEDSGAGFNIRPTYITATPYRKFVSEQSSRISYFQPVIEKLQYVEPAIVSSGPTVMLEGISDFHLCSYVLSELGLKAPKLSLVPGSGAGSLDQMISIVMSKGDPFLILLDDDPAGRRAAKRYKDVWFLSDEQVLTVAALAPDMAGKKLETLLSSETIEKIKQRWDGKSGKKQIGYYLAEINASGESGCISSETSARIAAVIGRAEQLLLSERF